MGTARHTPGPWIIQAFKSITGVTKKLVVGTPNEKYEPGFSRRIASRVAYVYSEKSRMMVSSLLAARGNARLAIAYAGISGGHL